MSLDKVDFAHQIQQSQFGLPPSFFSVLINPASGGINGTAMQLGQEYEIAISPCDHLWLPTFYDPSLGINPCQNLGSYLPNPASEITFQGSGRAGMNIFDVIDMANNAAFLVQTAAIFSLRFNSPSAAWVVWSLSNMLSLDETNAYGNTAWVGQGDSMRSITGPISRMWVKYLKWATVGAGANTGVPQDTIPGSQIVLLSSLGFNQQTVGSTQNSYATEPLQTGTDNALPVTSLPQLTVGTGSYGVGGGGYKQTNVNTLDRLELEGKGLIVTRRPDGR